MAKQAFDDEPSMEHLRSGRKTAAILFGALSCIFIVICGILTAQIPHPVHSTHLETEDWFPIKPFLIVSGFILCLAFLIISALLGLIIPNRKDFAAKIPSLFGLFLIELCAMWLYSKASLSNRPSSQLCFIE